MTTVSDAEMFRLLVEGVQDYSIYLLSTEGLVTSWNAGAQRIKGYSADEIVGRHFSVFFTGEDRRDGLPERILTASRETGRFETEGWRVRRDGSRFWAHVVVNAVHDRDGELIGFAKITRDVTLQRESTAALERLARIDGLTGLMNRSAFTEAVSGWIESGDTQVAIMVVDLDGFKSINDTHGHAMGDRVLIERAQVLAAFANEGCVVARLGGDEFTVAARFRHRDEVDRLTTRLQTELSRATLLDGEKHQCSASIGISHFPDDGLVLSDLLVKADAAMYQAKLAGGSTSRSFAPELLAATQSRRVLGQQIPEAVARNEFELVYQPQESLPDGSVVGYEALLRWNHPVLGRLSPGEFLPLAEANGAIIPLGSWVLTQACRDATSWSPPARVAVNISAAQLEVGGFVETVTAELQRTGLDPQRLEVEVTESVLITDRVRVHAVLTQLRELGVSVALDDFGTGFSSLDTLLTFPFDRIKVDRSVLYESSAPGRTREVLRAILALGHAIAASVLVEGVETGAQRGLLLSEGFDEIHGFYTGRPDEQ